LPGFFWRKHKKVTSGTVSTCFAAFPKPNMFTELQVPGKLFLQHPFKVASLRKTFPNINIVFVYKVLFLFLT
jgi:hypothetical protein